MTTNDSTYDETTGRAPRRGGFLSEAKRLVWKGLLSLGSQAELARSFPTAPWL